MKATFLGTADGYASAGREHSGIWVEGRNASMLLDCGASAARYLVRKKLSADKPDAIWVSHMHNDHVGQAMMLFQSLWLRGRKAPLHVYGPGPVLKALQSWMPQCLLFPELIRFPIRWHAVKPGRSYACGGVTLRPFATTHLHNLASTFKKRYPATCFECYGLEFIVEKKRFVYSADIATPSDLQPALKEKVDALFCEISHFPAQMLFQELAQHDIKRVFLTHYGDAMASKGAAMVAIARRKNFRGTVRLMKDKDAVTL